MLISPCSLIPFSTTEKSLASIFDFPSSDICIHLWDSPWAAFSLDQAVPALKSFFLWNMLQSLNHLHDLLLALFHYLCVSSIGEPRTGQSTPMESPQWWEEESLPCTCCLHCCWETPGCCWRSLSQGHIADSCSTCCPSGPPGPFLKICFPAVCPSMYWCLGLFLPRCRTSCLLLLIFMRLIMWFYSYTSHSCQPSAKTLLFTCDQCHELVKQNKTLAWII